SFAEPAVDVVGCAPLLLRGSFEHHKPNQPALLHIKGSHGKLGPRVATRHDDHPPARGKQFNGAIEVRLAQSLPPDIDSTRGELLNPLSDVIGAVIKHE